MVMVFVFSMSLSSCGDNNEETNDSASASLLIGRWFDTYLTGDYDVYEYLTFRPDGTGVWKKEYYIEDTGRLDERDINEFDYSYSANNLIIHYSNGTTKSYTVTSLTKNDLVFYETSYGYNYRHTFERE